MTEETTCNLETEICELVRTGTIITIKTITMDFAITKIQIELRLPPGTFFGIYPVLLGQFLFCETDQISKKMHDFRHEIFPPPTPAETDRSP